MPMSPSEEEEEEDEEEEYDEFEDELLCESPSLSSESTSMPGPVKTTAKQQDTHAHTHGCTKRAHTQYDKHTHSDCGSEKYLGASWPTVSGFRGDEGLPPKEHDVRVCGK